MAKSRPSKAKKAQAVKLRIRKAVRLKEYRELYRRARMAGAVKDKGIPSKFKPTKYMKTKLNKLRPYLSEEYKPLQAKSPQQLKTVREFKRNPSASFPVVFNGVLFAKRENGYEPSFDMGFLKLKRHLEAGTFERIPLPINSTDWNDIKEYFLKNEYLNDVLKYEDEEFAYRIFGNNSISTFGDLEGLILHLEGRSSGQTDAPPEDWFQEAEFELFRTYKDWHMNKSPQYKRRKERDAQMRKAKKSLEGRERRARLRKGNMSYAMQLFNEKKKRQAETPEQRATRLAKLKEYKKGYKRDTKREYRTTKTNKARKKK